MGSGGKRNRCLGLPILPMAKLLRRKFFGALRVASDALAFTPQNRARMATA